MYVYCKDHQKNSFQDDLCAAQLTIMNLNKEVAFGLETVRSMHMCFYS